jgi:hypothetical protein
VSSSFIQVFISANIWVRQLRPKVNHYQLTVEKGEGYNLNQSLFERLVIAGYPHQTLQKQHRMRPEISALIRELTYPDLQDAPGTANRPTPRGVRDFIVFIDHQQPEDVNMNLADRRDMDAKSSKQNRHEVEMVMKIVRYLIQQGYRTDDVVILTPYLGQLQQLQIALKNGTEPILSDMDKGDLIRAGAEVATLSQAGKKGRGALRLSTIGTIVSSKSAFFSLTFSSKITIRVKRVTLSSPLSVVVIPTTTLGSCIRLSGSTYCFPERGIH